MTLSDGRTKGRGSKYEIDFNPRHDVSICLMARNGEGKCFVAKVRYDSWKGFDSIEALLDRGSLSSDPDLHH